MLQTLLGRDGFRKGLDLYFERHDGEAATVEDFVDAMADASGRDLTQFMLWYTQGGTPELACSLDYDARAKTAPLTVSQVMPPTPGQTKKEPLLIPLKVGLLGAERRRPAAESRRRQRPSRRHARGDGSASRSSPSATSLAADPLAAARLLRAGQPHHQSRS